jgi:hypothetical protein
LPATGCSLFPDFSDVEIRIDGPTGDVDLRLYDSTGARVPAQSRGFGNRERGHCARATRPDGHGRAEDNHAHFALNVRVRAVVALRPWTIAPGGQVREARD